MIKIFRKILSLIQGHITVFKHSFKKRVTLEYPEVKPVIPERFRGKPDWYGNKCIGCKLCEKVCPAFAVTVDKLNDNINFKIDLSKCILCGNCMYNCPKSAIKLTSDFELATDLKENLIVNKNSKDELYE